MDRDPYRSGLIGDSSGDSLSDPPGSISREFETLGVIEFIDSLDQTHVSFLDQIQEQHASAGIFLGDRDDQSQVGADQFILRIDAVLYQFGILWMLKTLFDPLGDDDLLISFE